jgi:hypothetical protein
VVRHAHELGEIEEVGSLNVGLVHDVLSTEDLAAEQA